MPTLNLQKKTKRETHHNQTPNRELRQKYYNTTEWRKLRELYIKEHPIGEECLNVKGKVTVATSVHHRKSPFKNGECNKALFLDYDNLMSVCHECHAEIHNREQGHITVQDVLRQLADLLDENKTDEELE